MLMPLNRPDIFHIGPTILSTPTPVELTIRAIGPFEKRSPEQQVSEAYRILQLSPDALFPLRVDPVTRLGRSYGRTVLQGFPEKITDEDDPDAEPYIKWHR
jgi:hypothetical protein